MSDFDLDIRVKQLKPGPNTFAAATGTCDTNCECTVWCGSGGTGSTCGGSCGGTCSTCGSSCGGTCSTCSTCSWSCGGTCNTCPGRPC